MIPAKTHELLDKIMNENDLTIETIGLKIGVSRRSLYRVLNGEKPSGKLVVALIRLAIQLESEGS